MDTMLLNEELKREVKAFIKHPLVRELSAVLLDEGIKVMNELRRSLNDSNTNTIKQLSRTVSNSK